MADLLANFGLTTGELTQMVILAVVLLVGLFLARMALKLTAALFRIGCLAVLFIVGAIFLLNVLN